MNESLQIQKYQPDYLAIGDDGGGLIFLMKQDKNADEIFVVDISDYALETAFCKIIGFKEWFDGGCIIHRKAGSKNSKSGKSGNIYNKITYEWVKRFSEAQRNIWNKYCCIRIIETVKKSAM